MSNKLLKWLPRKVNRGFVSYLLAIIFCSLAFFSRLLIAPLDAGMPFITFFPAVSLAALFGGMGAGLFALLICTSLASYCFFPPYTAFTFSFSVPMLYEISLFCVEQLLVIVLVEAFYQQRQQFRELSSSVKLDQIRLQLLSDELPGLAGFLLDSSGNVLSWNAGAQKLYGFSSAETLGNSMVKFFPEAEHNPKLTQQLLTEAKSRGLHHYDAWQLSSNGGQFYAKLIISRFYDEHDQLSGFVFIVQAVSESQQDKQHLASIMQAIAVPLLVVNDKSEIVLANSHSEELFAYQAGELSGQALAVLIPESFHALHSQHLAYYFAKPETRNMAQGRAIQAVTKHGQLLNVQIALSTIHLADEVVVIASLIDLSLANQQISDWSKQNFTHLAANSVEPQPAVNLVIAENHDNLSEQQPSHSKVSIDAESRLLVETTINNFELAQQTLENNALSSEPVTMHEPDLLNPLPGFDMPGTLTRLYGDQQLLNKLLNSFVQQYADCPSQIESLLAEQKTETVAELLHRLHGAAVNLGAYALADAALQLKAQIRNPNSRLALKPAFYLQLNQSIEAIKHFIA